ncbi:MAG: 16S rRNA (guanine(527)-N(7))-methyltransferase RsmG [bacterium]|nr:16S rRNA (guanine(527)-N(7))-methyltransferase RsmG [bacterium]
MNKEEFEKELLKLGIDLTEKQKSQLEEFYNILIEENKKINLTRILEKEDVYLKHFYDSLTIVKVVDFSKINTLCDVGSGAGFPGIVLKIVFPNLKVVLIDSLQKRVNYLNRTIESLRLENIKAIHTRSEDYKETFDLVVARAVARLDKLINWCSHLIRKNQLFVAMKANVDDELVGIDKTLTKNNCLVESIEKFNLPKENSNRALVVIRKK